MKKFGVWFFGLQFIIMGIVHFIVPDAFILIMPENWPYREVLNIIAGIAEVILGIGFLMEKTRRISGYLICLMLLSFWVLHGIHLVHPPKPEWPFWGYLLRFLFQPILLILVWKLKDYKGKTV